MAKVCYTGQADQATVEEKIMDSDLLLYWMSSTGEASWDAFRRSVEELASPDIDLANLRRRLRVMLSDLAYIDFFLGGTQRWRVLPATLGRLISKPDTALLYGGRTPTLISQVEAASTRNDCHVQYHRDIDVPSIIHISGTARTLAHVAREAGLSYVDDVAGAWCQSLNSIPQLLESIVEERAPINWRVRSYDLQSMTWVEGLLPRSACEYSPMYGRPVYFLHKRRGKLLRMSRREAVYASATLQGVRLAEYDPDTRTLSTSVHAPLPEMFTRVASVCAGRPGEVSEGYINYKDVPPTIASVLLVAAGQPMPAFGDIVAVV